MSSLLLFFFFKQKTAYEMRISDWSSDVCSSDLAGRERPGDERASVALFDEDATIVPAPRRRWSRGTVTGLWSLSVALVVLLVITFLPTAYVIQQIGRASCRERVCQYV